MKRDKVEIYLHFVWTTWDRLPLLTPEVEAVAYRVIGEQVSRCGCQILALGGIEDHVHLLLGFPTTASVAHLMHQVRGGSSHAINLLPGQGSFRWRGGYAVFSVSRWNVRDTMNYIQRQKEHHRDGTTRPALECEE